MDSRETGQGDVLENDKHKEMEEFIISKQAELDALDESDALYEISLLRLRSELQIRLVQYGTSVGADVGEASGYIVSEGSDAPTPGQHIDKYDEVAGKVKTLQASIQDRLDKLKE